MKTTLRTIIVVLMLSGWVLAASALHVIRLPDGFIGIVPKDRLSFVDTYVDIRNWTPADAQRHPDLVRRLMAAQKVDWIASIVGLKPEQGDDAIRQAMEKTLDANAPPGETVPAGRPRVVTPHR